jgi:hypothetical protein
MGAQVVPDSVSGNFAHSEVLPGMIRLHIAPEQRWSGNVTYRLRGVVPGQFRVLPARIENIYNPEQTARSNPGALRVLAAGEANPDSYTLSPDELFHLGLWLAEDGEHVAAIEHLTPLFDGFVLRPDNERQVAEQILESAIALHAEAVPAPGATSDQLIVRFFEVLRERHPNVILTWDQTLEVARAYQAIEEFERSWQVLLGAAEASFLRDAQVAGVLEAQGAHRAAIAHLDNLIATYPDLQPVQSALYALGGAIEVKAKDAAIRDALKDDGLTVAELHQMSLARLEQFLVDYPDNPRVPEALLSLATLWVELEHRDRAIALCALLERTHSGSASVADAVYLQAYAHFLEGEDETALALCHRLAEEDFPTPAGARTPSVNRPQAHYITAQIRHAQGDPAAAVEAYRRIESRFPDAAQAIEHFLRRDLGLPEITRHAVGEDATVALTTRNLDDVHVRVFKVDLMTLYLLRRNLDQIVDVDLAGITPSLDQTIAVGAADDYLDHETEVALGVEEPGAYLVVAAAENLSASGLVLVTGLEVEVQEDPVSGRVRANVTHGDGTPVAAAAVRVIGANNPTFTAGETDRRGVMVADGIRGAATVLVRSGDQFAFHRGVQALQPPAEQPPMPFQTSSEGLYTNLGAVNSVTLGSQRALLDEITQNKQEGVDLYRVQQ